MFLSLERPHLKGVSIFVRNLVPEANFAPHLPNREFDSDRCLANAAVIQANRQLGEKMGKRPKAFDLFNQFNWTSTTGWEYWSEDYRRVLQHALLVSETLELPLNVHGDIMDEIISAAVGVEIDFDFAVATFQGTCYAEFVHTERDIQRGAYFTLIDVRVTKPWHR